MAERQMINLQTATDVLQLMRHHAIARADQQAVTLVRDVERDDTLSLTYAQLDAHAQRVAGWLQHRFAPGERMLLLHPVGLDFVIALMGCLYAGMIAVPAPLPGQYRHERHRVRAIAADAGIAAILTEQDHIEQVHAWAIDEQLSALPCVVTGDLPGAIDVWQAAPDVAGRTVLLQYTSGSTGDPKGVMIDHRNLLHNADSYRQALGFDEHTRFGGWIPLFHDMGLMAQLLPALFLGSTCVLMTPTTFATRPFAWLRMIDRYDIHYSAAPNFAFDLCTRRISDDQLRRLDLSRWRFATNGSEPVQAATLMAFARRFAAAGLRTVALCPCYGMAEATVYVAGKGGCGPGMLQMDADAYAEHRFVPAREGRPKRELVSCGISVGYEVLIVDPETREPLPSDRFGEIWLRGESVSRGYWQNDAATDATFRAETTDGRRGFLRSGDLGLLHDGELYVCGRFKEMLIANGRNLYPQDIEFELRKQHPELASRLGAVFGVPTDKGEAIVVTHEVRGLPDDATLQRLAQGIRATVSREFGAFVGGVVLLRQGSTRRTTSGKIQRRAMRDLFVTDSLTVLHESLAPEVEAQRVSATARPEAPAIATNTGAIE
jgi:acyl-CoA synthetase (AMP-forming)/AMP-acid ligase II